MEVLVSVTSSQERYGLSNFYWQLTLLFYENFKQYNLLVKLNLTVFAFGLKMFRHITHYDLIQF